MASIRTAVDPSKDDPDRQTRRRNRTRRALMDAARRVMGDKGVDATTLRDIASAADLGLGTFYNHFDDKETLVDAIATEAIEAMGAALDALTASLSDPAEVFSVSFRHTLKSVDHDPIWGWFVVRVPSARKRVVEHLGHRSMRDVNRGLRNGRFSLPGRRSFAVACEGILVSGMLAKLEGRTRRGDDERITALVLRMLGVAHDEADLISVSPLPAQP